MPDWSELFSLTTPLLEILIRGTVMFFAIRQLAVYHRVVPDASSAAALALDVSESPVQEHPRVHLDLYATDAADQHNEIERLLGLGASRVDWDLYPDDPDFVVLADTEGNRFCVIDASHG